MEPSQQPGDDVWKPARPPVSDFTLPNAAVRPGMVRPLMRGVFWLVVVGVAGLAIMYPRESLVQVLTFTQTVYETCGEGSTTKKAVPVAAPAQAKADPVVLHVVSSVEAPPVKPASVEIQKAPGGAPLIQVNGPGHDRVAINANRPAMGTQTTRSAMEPEQAPDPPPPPAPVHVLPASLVAPLTGSATLVGTSDWPRSVAVRGTPEVTLLERGSGDDHQYVAQTPHYEFQSESKLGADVVREFSRVFEATYELNNALPLHLHPMPERGRERFQAQLFSSDRAYFAAGGMPGSSGTYSRTLGCVLVPISSVGVKLLNGRMQTDRSESTETLIHEITHQMMNLWLPLLPRWYAEGSADYVAMADYLHGRFFLNQMGDRLRLYLQRRGQRGPVFQMLRPAELMALDSKTWGDAVASNAGGASQNYASATLLTYYFYHLDGDGDAAGILGYLHALEKGTSEHAAAKTYLLRGRTPDALENDLRAALQRQGVSISAVTRGGPVWE